MPFLGIVLHCISSNNAYMSARGCRDEAVRAPQPAAVPDQPGGGGPGLGGHTPGGVGQVSGPASYSSLSITDFSFNIPWASVLLV